MIIKQWPRRYSLIALSFISVFICYLDRINISVAIIPMSDELNWAPEKQGIALSAFFVGYMFTQILGGRLADKYGGKIILAYGVLIWSLATLITPPAAAAGFAILIVARIIMGLGEGVALPTIYSLYGKWLPENEKARAIGFTYSAIPLGSVIALLITPWIVVNFGWEWAFYSFGLLGFVWLALWMPYTASTPASHPTITEDEKALIEAGAPKEEKAGPLPLGKLLSAPSVWAIIIAHFCSNWATYVLLAWLPTYVNRGLGVDFSAIGLLTAIPYITAFVAFNLTGSIADRLVKFGWDLTRVRKVMQVIGFGGPALMLLLVGFVEDAVTAITLMSIGNAFLAFSAGGFLVNHLDIAPRHAGLLMGITNTVATIPGIVGVTVSGFILAWTGSWAAVFQTAAAVYVVGLIAFVMMATAKRQFE